MTLWTVASASTSAAGAALVAGAEARFRLLQGGASSLPRFSVIRIYLSVVGLSFCPYNRGFIRLFHFGDLIQNTPHCESLSSHPP